MTNTETHRQFYLGLAGVRMWYAKRPLPGAAPSPEFQFPVEDVVAPPLIHDEPVAIRKPPVKSDRNDKAARSRSVDLQSLMTSSPEVREAPAVEAAPSETVREPVVSEMEASSDSSFTSTPIAANLGFWSTGKYLLISQWSDEASERLQDSLAENVLKALHQPEVGSRQMLHWPVFRNVNIPGNSADDFREVLSRKVSLHEDCSVILLGVLGDESDSQRQHCLSSFRPRIGVDFPYSLAELSATPRQKRDLWNALKSCYSV